MRKHNFARWRRSKSPQSAQFEIGKKPNVRPLGVLPTALIARYRRRRKINFLSKYGSKSIFRDLMAPPVQHLVPLIWANAAVFRDSQPPSQMHSTHPDVMVAQCGSIVLDKSVARDQVDLSTQALAFQALVPLSDQNYYL